MLLSQLKAPKGAKRERRRVGRGQASGLGKTAGRGAKGQKARTGNMHFEGFEGGQMPLQRRLPKFGFINVFRRELEEVQVSKIDGLPAGSVVDLAALKGSGLAKGRGDGLVVLGTGELKNGYTVKANRVTAGARAAIEKAGGTVEILPKPQTMYEKAKAAKKVLTPEQAAKKAAKAAKKAAQAAEKAVKAAAKAEKPEKAEAKAEKQPKGEKPPKGEKQPKVEKKEEKKDKDQ
jgi:large subunit ribosomal protein L15